MKINRTFWGGALILAGLIFLLDALNIISVNVWGVLWSIAFIVVGIWILRWAFSGRDRGELKTVSYTLEGAEKARIRIRHGAGRLRVEGGASAGEILSGEIRGGIEFRKRMTDGTLTLDVDAPGKTYIALPFVQPLLWSLKLNETIPLELDVKAGANEIELDLSQLNVTDLRVNTGASDTTLTMPSKVNQTKVEVKCGVAAVRISIPESVAARIRAVGGLSSLSVDRGRFPRSGSYYQSPDFDTAEYKLDLNLTMGMGSLSVD
jgi:hypothetical protein